MLFSNSYDVRVGPLIPIRAAPYGVANGVEAEGLLDTGASNSVIPPQIANRLNLGTKLIKPLHTVSGIRNHPIHRIVMTLVLALIIQVSHTPKHVSPVQAEYWGETYRSPHR